MFLCVQGSLWKLLEMMPLKSVLKPMGVLWELGLIPTHASVKVSVRELDLQMIFRKGVLKNVQITSLVIYIGKNASINVL